MRKIIVALLLSACGLKQSEPQPQKELPASCSEALMLAEWSCKKSTDSRIIIKTCSIFENFQKELELVKAKPDDKTERYCQESLASVSGALRAIVSQLSELPPGFVVTE